MNTGSGIPSPEPPELRERPDELFPQLDDRLLDLELELLERELLRPLL
jgi:hypothetical protein